MVFCSRFLTIVNNGRPLDAAFYLPDWVVSPPATRVEEELCAGAFRPEFLGEL